MDKQLCTADDIFTLNHHKQYTLLATKLAETIMTDPHIGAVAGKLWFYLYTKASANKDLSITIKYKTIAQIFPKSERTLKRYVSVLRDNGYLVVNKNFYAHGQKANTYYIRVPASLINELSKTQDRKATTAAANHPKSSQEIDKSSCFNHDNNVMPDHDNNDIPNNNIYIKNNNTNNNAVVAFSPIKNLASNNAETPIGEGSLLTVTPAIPVFVEPKVEEQEHFLENLKQQRDMAESSWLADNKNSDKLMQFHQADTIFYCAKEKHETLLKTKKFKQQEQLRHKEITSMPNLLDQQQGDRNIPAVTKQRLYQALEKLGYKNTEKTQLANEIIYEACFGSLVISNIDQTKNTIDKAVNIALKLLREGRWYTPGAYNQFIYTQMKRMTHKQISQQ